jgi:F0F1-type ATP synthase assembly protein I
MRSPEDPKKSLNAYARYSGMALQMLVITGAGAFAGLKLDSWLNLKPLFTVILTLTAVVLSIYSVTKDLLKH